MKKRTMAALGAAALVAATAVTAWAHGGATGVVKERMELMEKMGDDMKALTAMMRGVQPYDAAAVRQLAERMRAHGGDAITSLFPEGSLDKPSEARPRIWRDWPRFEALSARLSEVAGALAAAAGNPRGAGIGGAPMGQGNAGMMSGQGMMGQGMMGQGMMDQGGASMMGGAGPSAEHLAALPPDAAFMHLADTCAACHETFRKEH